MKRIEKNCLIGTAIEIWRINQKLHAKGLYKVFVEDGYNPEKYYKLFIINGWVYTIEAFKY